MEKYNIGQEIRNEVRCQHFGVKAFVEDSYCENRLQVFDVSQIDAIAEEYFSNPCKKPLLIFYYDSRNTASEAFAEAGGKILGVDMIKEISVKEQELPMLECKTADLARLPHKAFKLMYSGTDIDSLILFAEKLAAETRKFVFVFMLDKNMLDKMYDCNGIPCVCYKSTAERTFNVWRDRAHIIVADSEGNPFARNSRLYGSYQLYKLISDIGCPLTNQIKFETLRKALQGLHTFSVTYEDTEDGACRCTIKEKEMTPDERNLFQECGIEPYKEIWVDYIKETDNILEYRKIRECK